LSGKKREELKYFVDFYDMSLSWELLK
jgi:hypothetical protein